LFRCPFCTNDELVDADTEHKHDGYCGDREWADELPNLPHVLNEPVADFPEEAREHLEWLIDYLPNDALYADLLLLITDLRP
jgi:hypothetical protein